MPYHPTLTSADAAVRGSQPYIAWYNVQTVEKRCKKHIASGLHESVFTSSYSRLEWFSAIRHRIAHGQADAKTKFDTATRSLNSKTYPGSRPGRFLRDWDSSKSPRVRWLESIILELSSLAGQIT